MSKKPRNLVARIAWWKSSSNSKRLVRRGESLEV